jgi:glycosyltransferase involved in cell wall biosynthesis
MSMIPRRLLRRAGQAVLRIRQSPAAARLRREIAPLLERASSALPSPFYNRLSQAVSRTPDPDLLRQALRTLRSIDLSEPRPGYRVTERLVSVVMPVRNRAGVVGEAIRSVLAQTHGDLELLICDDASTDRTGEVLASFLDPRIRLFRLETHKGAAPARNLCLGQASGEVIAYLDSDNLWHPRFLETVLATLSRAPEGESAYASYFDLELEATGRARLIAARIRAFDLEAQIDKPYIDINSFVHRRDLVNRFGGFDERLVRRQDYDLILRYCWSRPPAHLPYALNLYQRAAHLGQITRMHGDDPSSPDIIKAKIARYRRDGVPLAR